MRPPNNLEAGPMLVAELLNAETADDGRRLLTARLFTFGEQTRDYRKLSFVKGAVQLEGGTLPVAYAHQTGGGMFGGSPVIVGKVLAVTEDDEAAFADMEISTTPDADEVWTLIKDGALTKVSIGGQIVEYQFNEETEELTCLSFDLMEVSIVPVPAMRSAEIVSNKAGELVTLSADPTKEREPMETETTPAETTPDPTVAARLETIEDLMRERLTPAPPAISGAARPSHFRNFGELFGAVAAMDLGTDAHAREQLAHGLETGAVYFAPNGRRMVDVFAFEVGDSSDATGDAGQVNDLLKILRDGRVISAGFAKGDLDTVPGKTVDAPTVTENATVDYQTEAGAVASNKQEWSEDSFPKATLAGGQTVTVQARDWSRPSYMNEVLEDLVGAYGEKVNEEVVNGAGTTGPPQKVEGILVANTTTTSAIDAAIVAAIATAKSLAYAATKRWPARAYAAGATWATIEGMVDSENRPLLATDGPWNALGELDGPSPVGKIRGLVGYADDAIAAGKMIVPSFRDAKLWESKSAPIRVGLTYPDSLTVDVAVFGYLAVAIRRPAGFAIVDNIGATT